MSRHLPAELYSPEVVARLLAGAGRGALGKRNRALLAVLYHSGLRIREALALQQHDVAGARIHVRSGKGRKQRVAILRQAGLPYLQAWLEERGDRPLAPLFCGLDGSRLDTSAIRMLLPRIARRAGIVQRVHAHGFRHTHAVELMHAGVPLKAIQQQLGHSSLAVTDRYLDHVSPEAIEAMITAA